MRPNYLAPKGLQCAIGETWTLRADLEKRIQATEMRCYRKILCISYKDHKNYHQRGGTCTDQNQASHWTLQVQEEEREAGREKGGRTTSWSGRV